MRTILAGITLHRDESVFFGGVTNILQYNKLSLSLKLDYGRRPRPQATGKGEGYHGWWMLAHI